MFPFSYNNRLFRKGASSLQTYLTPRKLNSRVEERSLSVDHNPRPLGEITVPAFYNAL